jgi:mono/diheme cytochrome c family protein
MVGQKTMGFVCYFKIKVPMLTHLRFPRLVAGVWSLLLFGLLILVGCEAERRKSDAELGLNGQQASGRKLFDAYCDRCHNPYSTRGRQGPGLKGIFQKQYLPVSGLPANDDRVGEIIRIGRGKMEGFSNVLNQQQIQDLLAYLHTL